LHTPKSASTRAFHPLTPHIWCHIIVCALNIVPSARSPRTGRLPRSKPAMEGWEAADVKCPYCFHHDTRVLESRPTDEGAAVRRRRECLACNHRFTTYERIEAPPLMVVKKDGTREAFDRNKILQGMI